VCRKEWIANGRDKAGQIVCLCGRQWTERRGLPREPEWRKQDDTSRAWVTPTAAPMGRAAPGPATCSQPAPAMDPPRPKSRRRWTANLRNAVEFFRGENY